MQTKTLIVIGGGAAGIFCAVNAARLNPALKVTVLEKTGKLLAKVKISGGGRCNVTHACFSIADMVKKYPRGANFVKKTFHQFFTPDTIDWFKQRGVILKQEPDGRMFPATDDAQTIIECLLREANACKVDIIMHAAVDSIKEMENGYGIHTANGNQFSADFICVACGGYPKTSMFDWLIQLGHTIAPPVPSLFTFNMPGNNITSLMGIAVAKAEVKISGSKLKELGPLLITHWGMSGPAILKLSAWGARELQEKNYHFNIIVNWVPAYNEQSMKDFIQQFRFEKAAQKMSNKNPFQLPQRLWEHLLHESGISLEERWANLPAKEQNKLIKNICAGTFEVKGKTTFKEEFVTAGGIQLSEVDPNTMKSRLNKHIYFAGEIIDVDGVTGGFNFQHAWTSGYIAAHAIAHAV